MLAGNKIWAGAFGFEGVQKTTDKVWFITIIGTIFERIIKALWQKNHVTTSRFKWTSTGNAALKEQKKTTQKVSYNGGPI